MNNVGYYYCSNTYCFELYAGDPGEQCLECEEGDPFDYDEYTPEEYGNCILEDLE